MRKILAWGNTAGAGGQGQDAYLGQVMDKHREKAA